MEMSSELKDLLQKYDIKSYRSPTFVKTNKSHMENDLIITMDDLIDVNQIDMHDDQTWLYKTSTDHSIFVTNEDLRQWLYNSQDPQTTFDSNNKFIDTRTFTRPKKKLNHLNIDKLNDELLLDEPNKMNNSIELAKEIDRYIMSYKDDMQGGTSLESSVQFDLNQPISGSYFDKILSNANDLDTFQNMSPPSLVNSLCSSTFNNLMENSYIKNDPVLREIRDSDFKTDMQLLQDSSSEIQLCQSFSESCTSINSDSAENFLKKTLMNLNATFSNKSIQQNCSESELEFKSTMDSECQYVDVINEASSSDVSSILGNFDDTSVLVQQSDEIIVPVTVDSNLRNTEPLDINTQLREKIVNQLNGTYKKSPRSKPNMRSTVVLDIDQNVIDNNQIRKNHLISAHANNFDKEINEDDNLYTTFTKLEIDDNVKSLDNENLQQEQIANLVINGTFIKENSLTNNLQNNKKLGMNKSNENYVKSTDFDADQNDVLCINKETKGYLKDVKNIRNALNARRLSSNVDQLLRTSTKLNNIYDKDDSLKVSPNHKRLSCNIEDALLVQSRLNVMYEKEDCLKSVIDNVQIDLQQLSVGDSSDSLDRMSSISNTSSRDSSGGGKLYPPAELSPRERSIDVMSTPKPAKCASKLFTTPHLSPIVHNHPPYNANDDSQECLSDTEYPSSGTGVQSRLYSDLSTAPLKSSSTSKIDTTYKSFGSLNTALIPTSTHQNQQLKPRSINTQSALKYKGSYGDLKRQMANEHKLMRGSYSNLTTYSKGFSQENSHLRGTLSQKSTNAPTLLTSYGSKTNLARSTANMTTTRYPYVSSGDSSLNTTRNIQSSDPIYNSKQELGHDTPKFKTPMPINNSNQNIISAKEAAPSTSCSSSDMNSTFLMPTKPTSIHSSRASGLPRPVSSTGIPRLMSKIPGPKQRTTSAKPSLLR